MLTPAAMSIVMTTYAGRQRATALAVWGTIASMGIAAGVLFGGVLTSVLDWRAVFFINVPIGIVTLLGVLHVVPRGVSTGAGFRGLDMPGAITLVGGLLLLVNAVQSTNSHGWTAPTTVGSAAAALALLIAFARIERKVANPLVTPHIWKLRSLVSASAVMAGVTGALVGVIFLSSLFLQQVLGASAIVTGLEFLPLAAMITLSAAAASHLMGHAGPRLLIALGLVVSAAGALLLSTAGADATYAADVLPGFLVIGLGVGPMFVAISVGAMSEVPERASRARLRRDDDRPRGRRCARCRGAHRGRGRHHHPGRADRRPPRGVRRGRRAPARTARADGVRAEDCRQRGRRARPHALIPEATPARRPSRRAGVHVSVSWVSAPREVMPVLAKTLRRWKSTVRGLTNSWAATSRLDRPCCTSCATCSSVGVRSTSAP